MKSIIRLKTFNGMNFDIDYCDIKPVDSPLLADVTLSPIGALVAANGSTKHNTSALTGQVNGMFNYKSKSTKFNVVGLNDGTIQNV